MPKIKVHNRFGITPNQLLNDPKISWKAKGIYGYLQSKPEDWDFAVDRITNDAKDGRDSTSAGIKELEIAGYLMRKKYKNDAGQWEVDYHLFDEPTFDTDEENEMETTTENPQWIGDKTTTGFPATENPATENPEIKKERNTKKETVIKNYISNDFLNSKILEFIEARKQLKKPMTELAITKLVNKCVSWEKKFPNHIIGTFFDRAIECGWAGVFEQKQTIDYEAEKKKTIERENEAKAQKRKEEQEFQKRSMYEKACLAWYGKLPEDSVEKNEINAEVEKNYLVANGIKGAMEYAEGTLMREEKMRSVEQMRKMILSAKIKEIYNKYHPPIPA